MENKNKDKIIIGLIVALAVVIANNYIKNKVSDYNDSSISLIDTTEELEVEDTIIETNDTEDTEIKVHISGQINREGVYEINPGDRLEDLINQAGGLSPDADRQSLNLAMKLEDQMKIYIPNINETSYNNTENIGQIVSSPESENAKININSASKEELMSLPNIGEKRAEAIIEYRDAKKFETIDEIKNVTGIGEKFYQAIEELITI